MNWMSKLWRSATDKNFRHFSMKRVDGMTNFSQLSFDQKIALVLSNPAILKVIALQCDLFSLGKFYVYKGDQEVPDHKLLGVLRNPNPFQNSQEFLWEYMFWQMLGVSHVYLDNKDFDRLIPNKMYTLRPNRVRFPKELTDEGDKIILASKSLTSYMDHEVTYTYNNNTTFKFPYQNLISISDLGHVNSRFEYQSKIDALLKVIYNNEASMDSLNINTRYAGKFLVAGTADPDDVTKLPLSKEEKEDIEKKALGNNPVEAVKSMIDIKRFVDNAGNQNLDGIYLHTFFIIGSMYNIPRDVLEAAASSTYENQEKARGAHIDYCLQPKANLFTNKLDVFYGLTESGHNIVLDWGHLPFMQVFEEQRATVQYKKTQSLMNLLKAGIPIEEINTFLDTSFTTDESKQKLGNGTQEQQPQEGQGNSEGN